MLNSRCNLASVKLFKAGYLHCVTHEIMFVGKVLLNKCLSFVNDCGLGCCLHGQTFNHLQPLLRSFYYLGNFKTGGATF